MFKKRIRKEERKELSDKLKREADRLWWWHSIVLGDYTTHGHSNLECQQWISDAIPLDLSGKFVLDVGAADGYFSFLAERRGAKRVIATDNFQGRGGAWSHKEDYDLRTFNLAKKVLESKVEYQIIDVLDIEKLIISFDVVFFLGVYYHLREPAKALQVIYEKMNPQGLLILEGLVRSGSRPQLYYFKKGEIESTTYCCATIPWIIETARKIGFQIEGEPIFRKIYNPFRNLIVKAGWMLNINSFPLKTSYRAILNLRKTDEKQGVV